MNPITIDPLVAKMLTTIAGIFITIYTALFIFLIRRVVGTMTKSTDNNTKATKELTKEIQSVKITMIETKTKVEEHDYRFEKVEKKVDKIDDTVNAHMQGHDESVRRLVKDVNT